jgi:putative flippase GtrA
MPVSIIVNRLRKIRFIDEMLNKDSIDQFKRYLVIGFSTFFLEYAIFCTLHNAAKIYHLYANTGAYIIAFWFNFLMNRFWSFKSTGNLKRQLAQYLVLFAFNLGATNLLMYVLSDLAGIIPEISKVLVMGAIVSWNFVLYKKVIYK